jgi:glutamate racemase
MRQYDPHVRVIQRPCPLFVPLAEEGRPSSDPIVKAVVQDYLEPIVRLDPKVLVLGCTHYPLLKEAIAEVTGTEVRLVDSGEQTARIVAERLTASGMLSDLTGRGGLRCYVSDNPQRFRELGQRFLNYPVVDVTWISPEQFFASDVTSTVQTS